MTNPTAIFILKETYSHLNNGQIISSNILSSSYDYEKLVTLLEKIIKESYSECEKYYTITDPSPKFYDIIYTKALKNEIANILYKFDIIKIPVIV